MIWGYHYFWKHPNLDDYDCSHLMSIAHTLLQLLHKVWIYVRLKCGTTNCANCDSRSEIQCDSVECSGSHLLGGRRTVDHPFDVTNGWKDPNSVEALPKKRLNPTKGWNENILKSSKLQQKVWIHKERKLPFVRDWQKVLILGQHPHIITLVKGSMACHSQVRWLFLCSVFGAMINKPTHGSGDRHRSFPGGIFISLPPPSIFVFHRPAGPKLEREKDQGWQLWVQWISTSLIHGGSP